MSQTQIVDHAAIKTGQILTISTLIVAFALSSWKMVAALAIFFLLTSLVWSLGPFGLIYRLVLKPIGLVKPDLRHDNLQPHRFGQAVGAISAGLAACALYFGYTILGWSLVLVLVILTWISFMGWCIGCFLYFQLNRMGLRGFFNKTPTDTQVPLGSRPKKIP